MGKGYRSYEPDQEFLLPPSLRDWLPENHLYSSHEHREREAKEL
jgi:hypothetical protein